MPRKGNFWMSLAALALCHCGSPAPAGPAAEVDLLATADAGGAKDGGAGADAVSLADSGSAKDSAAGSDTQSFADVTADTASDAKASDFFSGASDVADGTAKDSGSDSGDVADSTAKDSGSDTGDVADSTAKDIAAEIWQPQPIPAVDPEPPPACAKTLTNNDYFQFLDNLCGEKVLPADADREFACPIDDPSPNIPKKNGQIAVYKPSSAAVVWEDLGLAALLPAGLQVAVIAIRRVGGVPHYRYLSNGTAEQAVQPWSTTKVLAAANAAATLRIQSNYAVGLTAAVGSTQLGDLVTSVVNYDSAPYSSNSLGAYFHNIGGRAKANALIHADWLQRPASESFGGNYGEAAPPGLGYKFVEPAGAAVQIAADQSAGSANNLSMFTLAEALKRLVLHREEPTQRLPGIQWKDLRVLLYGAENSKKYGSLGGMTSDTAIYLQAGHDIGYLNARAQGHWRIFSKLGLGTKGQFVHMGYACLPVLDPQGKPAAGWGREFVIAAHLPVGGATWKERDRILAKAYRTIVTRLIDGTL